MRRFKKQNERKRTLDWIKQIAKCYGAKNFIIYNYHILYKGKAKYNNIIFTLPNNFKIGVDLTNDVMYAEHLGRIDKFKHSCCEFREKFTLKLFLNFIDTISKKEDKEGELNYLKEKQIISQLQEIELGIGRILSSKGQLVFSRYINYGYRIKDKRDIEVVCKKLALYLQENLWSKEELNSEKYLSKYYSFMCGSIFVRDYESNKVELVCLEKYL